MELVRYLNTCFDLKRTGKSRDRILKKRDERLVEVLTAASQTWFYRKHWGLKDINKEDLQPRFWSIHQLKPVTKSELMWNFNDAVTDKRICELGGVYGFINNNSNLGKFYLDKYIVSHTSGSSGQSIYLIYPKNVNDYIFATQMVRGSFNRPSLKEGIKRLFQPARLAVVMMRDGFHPSAVSMIYAPKVAQKFIKIKKFYQTDLDLQKKLEEFDPHIVTGYSSALGRIKFSQLKSLRQITNNSEPLSEGLRNHLSNYRVLDNYACGECMFLSCGCPFGGHHINEDLVIVEPVDENYNKVTEGIATKLLITNLVNTVQPFIRYELEDQVLISKYEDCPCGSKFKKIDKVFGRDADNLVVDGKIIPFYVFKLATFYMMDIQDWQLYKKDDQFIMRFKPIREKTNLALCKYYLNEQLKKYGVNIDIEVEQGEILPEQNGKVKHIKC